MTDPTIRDEVLAAWRRILTREGAPASTVDVLVGELEQAAAGRGVRLPQRPRAEDPNTAISLPPPTAVRRADDATGYQAARAALRPRAVVAPAGEPLGMPAWPGRIETAREQFEIADAAAMQDDEASE